MIKHMGFSEILQIAWIAILLFIAYNVYNLYDGGYLIFNVNILQHNPVLPTPLNHHG